MKGGGLSLNESEDIINMVREIITRPRTEDEEKEEGRKISSKESGLKRSILVLKASSEERRCYLLFTSRKKNGDKMLGEGAYKKVKYALRVDYEKGDHKLFAVATISNSGSSKDIKKIDDARKEVSCLKNLRHIPEVVNFENSFDGKSKFYLILEHCHRGNLFSYIHSKDSPPLQDSQKHQLAADIVNGIARMHEKGWYHCDIKQENILITSDLRARIADFGLSVNEKIFSSEDWKFTGTECCISPDLIWAVYKGLNTIVNRAEILMKTDAWALGLVLFTLFHPNYNMFRFQISDKPKYKILKLSQKEIDGGINELSNDIFAKSVIRNLLQVDPQMRWSVQQAAQRLSEFPLLEKEGLSSKLKDKLTID